MEQETKMQQAWESTRFSSPSEQQMQDVINGVRRTALQKLAAQYKRFAIIATVLIVPASFVLYNADFYPEQWLRITVPVLYALGFCIIAIMDSYLYQGIKSINVSTMSVQTVISKALHYRKRHLQCLLFTVPWACAVLGLLFYSAGNETAMMLGMVCGLAFGLVIGINMLLKFLRYYREISEQ